MDSLHDVLKETGYMYIMIDEKLDVIEISYFLSLQF